MERAQQESKESIAEEVLWIEHAKHDPALFKPLYERYFKRVYVFVLKRVGDQHLAADLTQQVFVNALSGLGKYKSKGIPFSSWLFRIAINQCYDFFRRTKRDRVVVVEEETLHNIFEELTANDTLEQWKRALPLVLERLSEKDLQFIELRFFQQHSFREMAELLDISEVYAKVKTYRILDRMKSLFNDLVKI